jgi:hypothetical protein
VPHRPFLAFTSCTTVVGSYEVTLATTMGGPKEGVACSVDALSDVELTLVGARGEDFRIGDRPFVVGDDGTAKAAVSVAPWFGAIDVASFAESAPHPTGAKPTSKPLAPWTLPVAMTAAGSTFKAQVTLVAPPDSLEFQYAAFAQRWAELAAAGKLPAKGKELSGALLLLGDDQVYFTGKPKTLDDVRYLATHEVSHTEITGKCGPYDGGGQSYLDIQRSDYRITIVDRNGKKIAEREFRGQFGGCPESFMSTEDEGELVMPARPATSEILAWVATVAK